MESLIPPAEPKAKSQIDRVTLNKNESEKVNAWLNQINKSTKGFLELNRSDLVNFLVKSHADELTKKEIKNIRLAHYSLIKHLNWITPQLKKAIDENNYELVKSLQLELKSLEIGVIKNTDPANTADLKNQSAKTKKIRKQKIKNNLSIDKNETAGSDSL